MLYVALHNKNNSFYYILKYKQLRNIHTMTTATYCCLYKYSICSIRIS